MGIWLASPGLDKSAFTIETSTNAFQPTKGRFWLSETGMRRVPS